MTISTTIDIDRALALYRETGSLERTAEQLGVNSKRLWRYLCKQPGYKEIAARNSQQAQQRLVERNRLGYSDSQTREDGEDREFPEGWPQAYLDLMTFMMGDGSRAHRVAKRGLTKREVAQFHTKLWKVIHAVKRAEWPPRPPRALVEGLSNARRRNGR